MPPRKKTKLTVAADSTGNESIGAGDRDQVRTVVRRRISKGSLQSLPEFAVEVQLEVSIMLHGYLREYTRIRLGIYAQGGTRIARRITSAWRSRVTLYAHISLWVNLGEVVSQSRRGLMTSRPFMSYLNPRTGRLRAVQAQMGLYILCASTSPKT